MADNIATIPQKGLWALRVSDVIKGIWLSVGTSVLALGYLLINNHWRMPTFVQMEPYLNAIGIGFLSYMGKTLSTNNVGQLFQKDKPVVHVEAAELAALQQKAAQSNDASIQTEGVTSDDIVKKNS